MKTCSSKGFRALTLLFFHYFAFSVSWEHRNNFHNPTPYALLSISKHGSLFSEKFPFWEYKVETQGNEDNRAEFQVADFH